jgi:hypothetical protein
MDHAPIMIWSEMTSRREIISLHHMNPIRFRSMPACPFVYCQRQWSPAPMLLHQRGNRFAWMTASRQA